MEMVREDWRCIWEAQAVLGEGPLWVAREAALYWVDIKRPAIHRLVPATGARSSWTPPCRVGALAPRRAGGFIAGTDQGIASFGPDMDDFQRIADPEPERPGNRFNDGKTDPAGRFWAGTMDDREQDASGALYRIDPDLSWTRVDDGYHVTNGPAFSPDGRRMYHSDSAQQVTYVFDLAGDGTASNKRAFARFGDADGYPDGMTVDAEGCVWIAFWDGWCVRRLSPHGERLATYRLPVARPTCPVFGGEKLDRLFVTSARTGLDAAALDKQPQAGALFELIGHGTRGLVAAEFPG